MTDRLQLLRDWLTDDLALAGHTLTVASEDASFRRYFRVSWGDRTAIVMDAPPDKEDCGSYIDITARLLACNVNAASIRAQDLEKGFLLLDDLGSRLYLDVLSEKNVQQLYGDAINAIIKMQSRADITDLPRYDEKLLRDEMELFREWLLGKHLNISLTPSQQEMLDNSFLTLMQSALEQPQVFVHRDYHSRNLLVNEANNPGVVDHQDAVYGPLTYDPVSLLKDCYIKWPKSEVRAWAGSYYQQVIEKLDLAVDADQFLRWFDLMGVQRHLKASGIFARLYHRDNKAGFLKDIPRTLSYITDLKAEHAELTGLIEFIEQYVLPELSDKTP